MKKYLLAHDLGTSGNKATLFTLDGELVNSKVCNYPVHYFNSTWAEQNPEDWWNAVCKGTLYILNTSRIRPDEIAAVSFSGQMMGCLPLDKYGSPLRPSIIWADQRAVKQSKSLEEAISQEDFYHIVGHRNTPSYGVQKLMWIRDNEPEIYKKTYKVLNAKDYIVFKLTGHYYTDPSDANSVACFDLKTFQWSEKIINASGIDRNKLPEIIPSSSIAGEVTAEAANETGLKKGTLIIMGGGDGAVANVGCGSISPGKTYCCLGTSAWVTTTSKQPLFDKEMRTVTWAHVIPGLYCPNGTMQYAGGAYSWLKNTLALQEKHLAQSTAKSAYDYMNAEIEKSVPGSNGVIFLPYMLGERAPRWNPEAKGAWIGLKPETTRSDIFRSVMEGITMNLAICLDILREQNQIEELTVVGGGAKGKIWQQIMSNIFNAKILVPHLLEEGCSMGAAVLAGIGAGIYKDFTVINRFLKIDNITEPDNRIVNQYTPIRKIFDDSYYALKSIYSEIAILNNENIASI